jgi:hypothetical protein
MSNKPNIRDLKFTYDINGNQITNANTSINYTAFNKTKSIITANNTISFFLIATLSM